MSNDMRSVPDLIIPHTVYNSQGGTQSVSYADCRAVGEGSGGAVANAAR